MIKKKSYKYRENHHNWKGDKAGNNSIHIWLNRNYPRKGICEICGRRVRTSWTFNKHPNPYTRDIKDYTEKCDKCHNDRKKKIFLFSREELIKLYWISEYNMEHNILDINQKTNNEIGKIKNCTKQTILRNMKNFNMKERTQRESKKLQYMKQNECVNFTKKELIELYWLTEKNMKERTLEKNQKSAIEIAKLKNTNETTIRNNMEYFNIPRRTQSEAHNLFYMK